MDLKKLSGIIPDNILAELTLDFLAKATIDGPLRLSNFLGQCNEESEGFKIMEENLNYTASQLKLTFPKEFQNINPFGYQHQPEKIANLVYANRDGNGNEESGDGYEFRGRGLIQITGKSNYEAFQDYLGDEDTDVVEFPDIVSQPEYALLSAIWFFTSHNLWEICDKGTDIATVTILTRHINGGTNGLQTRFDFTQKVHNALMAS